MKQTGAMAARRRAGKQLRESHKEAIEAGTVTGEIPPPLVPEIFQDIETIYWDCLKAVPDPRSKARIVYPLYLILHRIISGFLGGARFVGVLFPATQRKSIHQEPGVKNLGALPTLPAVYALLRRIDWEEANAALAPLWERLGYSQQLVVRSKFRSPQTILEEALVKDKEKAEIKKAKYQAEKKAAEKAEGMSAARAKRLGKPSSGPQKVSRKTPLSEEVLPLPSPSSRLCAPEDREMPRITAPSGISESTESASFQSCTSENIMKPFVPDAFPKPTRVHFPLSGQTILYDLLLDGKVVKASYNNGCKERFVHVTAVRTDAEGVRRRFIVGACPTVCDRHGEWGAAMSILDALLPFPDHMLISGDAGMCVTAFAAWASGHPISYLFRIKQNAGGIFDRVIEWAQAERIRRPEGDFYESCRISGADIHSRRLWRLPGLSYASFPGITEGLALVQLNGINNQAARGIINISSHENPFLRIPKATAGTCFVVKWGRIKL